MGYNITVETTDYYENRARHNHPEIRDEWVERVLANPYHSEVQLDGRIRYWGYIEEAERWVRVVLEEGKLFNRSFDRVALRRWGKP